MVVLCVCVVRIGVGIVEVRDGRDGEGEVRGKGGVGTPVVTGSSCHCQRQVDAISMQTM